MKPIDPAHDSMAFSAPSRSLSGVVLLVSITVTAWFAVIMGQDVNWDLRNYHFYNVYAFLNDRLAWDVAPAMIQSYLNPLADFLPYFIITHLPPVWMGIIIGGIQGLNIWLLFHIAWCLFPYYRMPGRALLSLVLAALGFYGVISISELGTTLQDTIISIFTLGGLLLFLRTVHEENLSGSGKLRRFFLSGLIMGLGTGLKTTAAIYLIGMIPVFLFTGSRWIERMKQLVIWCSGSFIGILITGGYWMLILYRQFGNPLFPFYNALFKSPFFDLINFTDDRFLPRNVQETLFYPFYFGKAAVVSEPGFTDYRFAVLYVLVLLAGCVIAVRRGGGKKSSTSGDNYTRLRSGLIVFTVTSYLTWQTMFSVYRYLAVLEMLSFICMMVLLAAILQRRWISIASVLLIGTVVGLTLQVPTWGRKSYDESYFGVEIPEIPGLDQALVLIPSYYPVAYTLPFFPKSTRFIRIEGTFFNPGMTNATTGIVREAIHSHQGDFYLLTRASYEQIAQPVVRSLGFKFVWKSQWKIVNGVEPGMRLYRLEPLRTPGPQVNP